MRSLRARPGKSDVVVFYSGHGVPGMKDKRAYLLPAGGNPNRAEITGYPVDLLYANLAKLPARSMAVFLDACFSGESSAGMVIKASSGISVVPRAPTNATGLATFSAARADQLASWDEDAQMGLFTKHLLEALYGAADGEDYGNSNGKISLAEVKTYLGEEMTYQARRRFGRRQHASVSGGEELILASVSGLKLEPVARAKSKPKPKPKPVVKIKPKPKKVAPPPKRVVRVQPAYKPPPKKKQTSSLFGR